MSLVIGVVDAEHVVVLVNVVVVAEVVYQLHLERLPVRRPKVVVVLDVRQVVDQVLELAVLLVLLERRDGNPVVQLRPERVHRVVHDDQVLQVPVPENPQVLYVHLVVRLDAAVSVESVLDVLLLGVDVVEDHVRVPLVGGGEADDLEVIVAELESLLGVGADVEAGLEDFSVGELDVEVDVGLSIGVLLADAVGEGLVEVEDDGLFDSGLGEGELDDLLLPLLVVEVVEVLEEVDGLENVDGEFSEDRSLELGLHEGGLLVVVLVLLVDSEDILGDGRGKCRNQGIELRLRVVLQVVLIHYDMRIRFCYLV